VTRTKGQWLCLLGILLILLAVCAAWAFGADLLQQIYEGRSSGLLNRLIRDQSLRSLDAYLDGLHGFLAQASFAALGLLVLLVAGAFPSTVRTLTRVSFAVVCALLLWRGARWLWRVQWAISYPFGIDYGEGPVLGQVLELARGGSLYASIGEPPFVVTNYPPVYQGVVTFVSKLGVGELSAGRSVSVAATLVTALLIAALVAHASSERGRVARLAGASAGGLLFLAIHYVWRWSPLMRVDMLSIAWSMAGLAAFTFVKRDAAKVLICVCFFLLALFTRQSAIAAPVACLLVGLTLDRGLASRLFAALMIGGCAVLASAVFLTDGHFWAHVVDANRNGFSPTRLGSRWYNMAWVNFGLLAVAVPTAVHCVRSRTEGKTLLGVYFFCALLVSATVGKVGSSVNYLIEALAAASALGGVAVAWAVGMRGRAPLAVMVLLWFQLSLPHALQPEEPGGLERRVANSEEALERIRAADGPVVSEDNVLLGLAGRPIYFQPFVMTQLHRQGRWSQEAFLAQLNSRELALIVLERDVQSSDIKFAERFSPEVREAIGANYRKTSELTPYHLYEPR